MTPPDRSCPIGIFDSGFGGLTVMRAVQQVLPHEEIIYFADTAHLPYGNKSCDQILAYSQQAIAFLTAQHVKLIIIACHSACTAALEQLRAASCIPIVGITEQAIDETIRSPKTCRIAVLGTQATIDSGLYQRHLHHHLPHSQLTFIACPRFVPLIEEERDRSDMIIAAQEHFAPLKENTPDAALLACTHFPLLQSIIQEELGHHVSLIDPSVSCAADTQTLLGKLDLINAMTQVPNHRFFVTGDPQKFQRIGQRFLKMAHVHKKE